MPSNVSRNSVIERPTKRALEVVVETGTSMLPDTQVPKAADTVAAAAIYCAHLLILIVSSSIGSNVFFIFLDPVRQTEHVAYNFVLIPYYNFSYRPLQ